MKKIFLFIYSVISLSFSFVIAENNSTIEHIGHDIVLTNNDKVIIIYDEEVESYLKCPEGYSMGTKEQWSDLIKMRWDIKGKNYENLTLNKSNSLYKLHEEYIREDLPEHYLNEFRGDIIIPGERLAYKTKDFPYYLINSKYHGIMDNWCDGKYGQCERYFSDIFLQNCSDNNTNISIGYSQYRCDFIKKIQITRCFKNNPKTEQTNGNGNDKFSKEYNDAYTFAYNNKITTMPTIEEANMTGEIIRAEIAKMFANWMKSLGYEIDNQRQCKFTDIASVQGDLSTAIIESCQLGIMGQGIKQFRPYDKITKAEVATAISRIIWGDKYNGGNPFYIDHINALKEVGVIDETSDINKNELRGNVMLMLMKANGVIKNN